jgi:arylformamidase
MHTYDISLTVSPDLPVWPGDPKIELARFATLEEGGVNVSRMALGVHTGTHIDAPNHFVAKGRTVDRIPIETLTGRAYVLHLPTVDLITAAVLERSEIPPRTRRILFKTRNSDLWARQEREFKTDFVALSPDGAEYLATRGFKLVGIDYLSIAPYASGKPTHEILLKAGLVVVEGLDLSMVTQGRYTLYCLPLKLLGADGAPARAILIGV